MRSIASLAPYGPTTNDHRAPDHEFGMCALQRPSAPSQDSDIRPAMLSHEPQGLREVALLRQSRSSPRGPRGR